MFFVPGDGMVANWASAQKPSIGQNQVLIVEDESMSRRALSLLMSNSGFTAAAFGSAEEALHWLEDGAHPRIALIDLNLPGMNGLDLIDRLRKLSPATFPVLITATDEQTLAGCLKQRPVTHLRKPLDFDLLLSTVSRQPSNN
jgi:CheY-like chemotaxis protein